MSLDGKNVASGSTPPISPIIYDSIAGHDLCKKILAKYLPFEPHDYQLDGVCPVLDGLDLLATTPTGSGKTGFFIMLMLVARKISRDETIALGKKKFPCDPAMLIVCPTKALEYDLAAQMEKAGLTTIILNSDTIDKARRNRRKLWEEARSNVTMILLSPEQLTSSDFTGLLNSKEFWAQIFAMGMDEAHLMYFWGALFQKCFRHIGLMRAHLPSQGQSWTPLVALTATLHAGVPLHAICKFLGLHKGKYHFIRRSNARHDIQYIVRDMQLGLQSINFPELDWVLTDDQKKFIFCATIALGFRITCYLCRLAKRMGFENSKQRIRMFNSLNWSSYNAETLGYLNNNEDHHSKYPNYNFYG